MTFSDTAELAPGYRISRVIRGGWQLAGGHGAIEKAAVPEDLLRYYQAGITAFDCADIYTGVEEMIGAFRAQTLQRLGAESLNALKVHTKFVPDLDVLPRIDRAYVASIIDRSLQRLKLERLDLVQFHWWDYAIPGCVETALWLTELQKAGKIDLIGGTNFDTAHVAAMVEAGAPLKSLQVQYSALDHRPAAQMAEMCARLGVQFLCYGSVAGGFLSERWLGQPEPMGALENRSLVKYKLIIDDFGGWDVFQALLRALKAVAVRRDASLAAVASRYVLEKPGVAAVIVGARNASHLTDTVRIADLRLGADDIADIDAAVAQGRPIEGDVYTLERDRTGRHGAIMKYNLNA